uniref:Uncharacterized protein n=1 Tax=Anguilla anguilla TaxID=7936 RepID=A0A0E9RFQ0_ANGAN
MENTIHFFHRPLFLYLKVTEKLTNPKGTTTRLLRPIP